MYEFSLSVFTETFAYFCWQVNHKKYSSKHAYTLKIKTTLKKNLDKVAYDKLAFLGSKN